MRDITKELTLRCPEQVGKLGTILLQVDANVLAKSGVAVAGGAIRDLYFGNRVKDVDLIFYGMTVPEFMATFEMWRSRHCSDHVWAVHGEDADYNGSEEAIACVIKITLNDGTPVDWILYRDCYSREDVLAQFDHSINQFCMFYDSEFRVHIHGPADWGVCTRNPNADLSPERVERFIEFARVHDWEYN